MTREALKLALEALTYLLKPMAKGWDAETQTHKRDAAITAIKQALAAPVQEPVAWHDKIIGMEVSMDVSTDEDDAHHRVFGRVYEVMLKECGSDENVICAIEDSRNFATPPAAPVQELVAWMPITEPYPPGDELDILMGDGSILCAVLPQADGDLWWGGSGTGEKFIDPQYTNVTHWRIHSDTTPPAAQRQWTDMDIDTLAVLAGFDPTHKDDLRRVRSVVEAILQLKEKNI